MKKMILILIGVDSGLQSKKLLILSLIILATILSCSKDDFMRPNSVNENTRTLQYKELTREYILYAPEGQAGSSKMPLMLNFHGFGMSANDQVEFADMRPLVNSEKFILVYPQGTLLGGYPHWNSGLDTPDNKSDADDFGFVEALINEISANYNIDTTRIYACGYSNGAFFTYSLACYYSDRIAAFGSVSGTMMTETYDNCRLSHPMAMINLHGTSDYSVPYDGGEGLVAIDKVLDYWVTSNNANTMPAKDSYDDNGTTIERYFYADGDSGVSIEHYKIIDGEHVWFDTNYEGKNTSRLIWDFVSKYDINGLR